MLDLKTAREKVDKIALGNIVMLTEEVERLALEVQAETLDECLDCGDYSYSDLIALMRKMRRKTSAEIARMEAHDAD